MTYVKNAILGVLAIALIASGAPVANGQTTADMQAQIAALLAQVQALTAQLNAGTSASVTFTRNLTVGSTGADVMALQQFLNANGCPVSLSGAGAVGMESSYFGAKTKAAVACWQAAHNISPAVGYFGPTTRAAVNAMVVVTPTTPNPTTPTPTTPGVLSGGAGSITDADFVANLNNEEVGEDATDVEVAGLEIEADQGSDIELQAVRLVFVNTNVETGSDDDFEDYADEVSVWFDGEEVARVDADDFDDDNSYSRTLSLESGAIIRADDTGELVVAVSGVSNLDSANIGEHWTIQFELVRFRDAQNAIVSDSTTGDIGGVTRTFSFESFATATDVELEVVESNNNPEAGIVEADDSSDTDDVLLTAGQFRNNGDSDIEIKSVSTTVTVAGTATTTVVASSFTLVIDGDDVQTLQSTECVGTPACNGASEDYVFDDVDFDLGAGDDVDFEVRANINNLDGSLFVEGDSLLASVDADGIVAEDESGEDLTASELKGSVTGNEQVFYTIFPEVTVNDTSISYVGENTANANVSFDISIRAVGGTIYLNGDDETTSALEFASTTVLGGNASTSLSAMVHTTGGTFTVTNNGADDEYYTITSGNTMNVTITGTLTQSAGSSIPAGAEFDAILFGTTVTNQTTRSANVVDFDDLMDELETGLLTLIGA